MHLIISSVKISVDLNWFHIMLIFCDWPRNVT